VTWFRARRCIGRCVEMRRKKSNRWYMRRV
jgi:hypothetical protein